MTGCRPLKRWFGRTGKRPIRQRLFVKKARLTENHLVFVVSALKRLFMDENFLTLLRAERLDTLPAYWLELRRSPRVTRVQISCLTRLPALKTLDIARI